MKKHGKKRLSFVLSVVGISLILVSVVLVVTNIISTRDTNRTKEITESMYALMPEIKNGSFDDRINMTMPSLEIDGENFCGIIDIPAFQCSLPVSSSWEKGRNTVKYPGRYMGSVYDGSLIIGGSDNSGQFDFMKAISINDYVYFIDTTGARYPYIVIDAENTKDVTTDNLTSKDADIVLFSVNTYSLDYTVVRCKLYVGGQFS